MKNTITHFVRLAILFLPTAFCLLPIFSYAQAPQKFNYQGIARGNAGNVFSNQLLGFKLSVLQGSAVGTSVYVETQAVTSDSKGIFSLEVGGGTVVSGVFSSIGWGADSYWLKTEMDTTGGSNYQVMGTTQMISVPYALNAGNGNPAGIIAMWSGLLTNIPSGWALCDGTSGTPDLRDKFIYGVSTAENPGAIGGNTTHTHSVPMSDITTGASSSSQLVFNASNNLFTYGKAGIWFYPNAPLVSVSPNGSWNYYGASSTTTGNGNNLPPYYKLAFIMKL